MSVARGKEEMRNSLGLISENTLVSDSDDDIFENKLKGNTELYKVKRSILEYVSCLSNNKTGSGQTREK